MRPYLKITKVKKAGGVAQLVESLPRKHNGHEFKPLSHQKKESETDNSIIPRLVEDLRVY
jgi:hypothetical protein